MSVLDIEEEHIMLSTSDSFADFAVGFGAASTCSQNRRVAGPSLRVLRDALRRKRHADFATLVV